ncbi:MAG: carbohydrate kinase family protein, partial [Gammaproteobacteria bacterium]|nr:carbohydrate kinase family protein [Gammaproteobacteria bacterium]
HNAGRERTARIGGGAANTAMALATMAPVQSDTDSYLKPVVISAVGNDTQGKALLTTLREVGVCVDRIDCLGAYTTRSLVLLEKKGERTIINLTRAPVPLPPDLAHIPADCCYVRSADPALTPILAKRVEHSLVIAHIPPTTDGFRPAQVLVGSASDLDRAFLADPFSAGRRIAGRALEWVVITFGADGAAAYGDGAMIQASAPVVHVIDTTGAGDVFAGGLAFALAMGEKMPTALKTAIRWGSASVGYEGTVPGSFYFAK